MALIALATLIWWCDLQDAALRHVGPFIQTMETITRVTISLTLPMIGLLLKALSPETPIVVKDYSDINKPVNVVLNVRLFCLVSQSPLTTNVTHFAQCHLNREMR
jgi:hypothetical protein